jgi:hypothetical protein
MSAEKLLSNLPDWDLEAQLNINRQAKVLEIDIEDKPQNKIIEEILKELEDKTKFKNYFVENILDGKSYMYMPLGYVRLFDVFFKNISREDLKDELYHQEIPLTDKDYYLEYNEKLKDGVLKLPTDEFYRNLEFYYFVSNYPIHFKVRQGDSESMYELLVFLKDLEELLDKDDLMQELIEKDIKFKSYQSARELAMLVFGYYYQEKDEKIGTSMKKLLQEKINREQF